MNKSYGVFNKASPLMLIGLQYQELFALCQALPGPGSTKMLYAINVEHYGFWLGLLAFFIWRYGKGMHVFYL